MNATAIEKENCVIWGIGNVGSSPTLMEMLQARYNVNFDMQSEIWVANLINEADYWRERYSRTNGEFVRPYIQNRDFSKLLPEYEAFSARLRDGDRILDLGSGIVSKFGNITSKGCEVSVSAVDPLAYY